MVEPSPELDRRDRALLEIARSESDPSRFANAIEQAHAAGLSEWELLAVCDELHHPSPIPGVRPEAARMLPVADHETRVVDIGHGEPLIVLHSLGLDSRSVRDFAAVVSGSARLVAYDLRSHGASTAAPGSFDLSRCATDVIELLDLLDIQQAHVAGFSLGGAIAQIAALRFPERVRSLVLVCTMSVAKPQLYLERARAAEQSGSTAIQVAPTLRRWFSDRALTEHPWYVRYARERVRRASVQQWSRWWRSFARLDISGDINRINCPTTLVAAEGDRSTPPDEMVKMAASIPGATFHVIPDGSHLAILEQPRVIAMEILEHLRMHGNDETMEG